MNGNCRGKDAFIAAMSLAIAMALGGCDRDGHADAAAVPSVAQDDTLPSESLPTEPAMTEPMPATGTSAATGGVASQFAMMDGDGDGKVTREEHAAGAGSMFTTMDADGNGNVTAPEMDISQQALDGDPRMTSADKIKAIDSNADGMLSREEHEAGSSSMFQKMDGDGDGALTAAEMQAGHDSMIGG